MAKRCLLGFICTPGTSMILMCIAIIVLVIVVMTLQWELLPRKQHNPVVIYQIPVPNNSNVTASTAVVSDLRYSRAPKPLKRWMYSDESGDIMTGLHTRGTPEQYQSVGIISIDGSGQNILPLYGRRTYGGRSSDRWNYYTRTDTYNPVQISIKYKNRDCVDEIGCNELYSGDTISVNGINKNGSVQIYPNDSLRQ